MILKSVKSRPPGRFRRVCKCEFEGYVPGGERSGQGECVEREVSRSALFTLKFKCAFGAVDTKTQVWLLEADHTTGNEIEI